MRKNNKYFIEGAVRPDLIAGAIASHSAKKTIGAHSIFLGQVRADQVSGKTVTGIEYSCFESMAVEVISRIREEVLKSTALNCLHVTHSTGFVKAGEICLFVFASSAHRGNAIRACEETVEKIKKEVPVFGKEIFEDATHQWKVNT